MSYHVHIEVEVAPEDADWAANEIAAFASDFDQGVTVIVTDEKGELL